MTMFNELAVTNPTGEQFAAYLESIDICDEAVAYVRSKDNFSQAWNDCVRGDWMLWILNRANGLMIDLGEANELLIQMYYDAGNPPLNNSDEATDVPDEGPGNTTPVVDFDEFQSAMASYIRQKWNFPDLASVIG